MTTRRRLVVAATLLIGASSLLALRIFGVSAKQSIDPQQVVDQFYPQALIDKADPPGTPGGIPLIRKSGFTVLEQEAGVPRTILACYSNGSEGSIRLIRRINEVYSVVYESEGSLIIGGIDCSIKTYDFMIAGSPVRAVSFQSFSTPTADWFFRWDGNSLINVGPTETKSDGRKSTLLSDSFLLNLDHTSSWQLVNSICANRPGSEINCAAAEVYRLSEQNVYVLDRTLLYLEPFAQPESSAQTWTSKFDLPTGTQGPYRMKVVNGKVGGFVRTASGTIILNGVTVVTPAQLNLQVEFVTVSVDLLPMENTLQVTLANRQGAEVWVYFEKVQ